MPTAPDRVGKSLQWKGARFSNLDYAITGIGAAVTLAAAIIPPRSQHSLSKGILFDDAVRDALRPDDIQTRYRFRDASDVGLSLAVTWPFFADALTTAWWYRGSRDVAEQMALVDLQALAVVGALYGTTNVLVARERPYGRVCGSDELPDAALDCRGSTHYRSFFSGHAAFSFTGAALICVHRMQHDLLGPTGDALSCVGGYAVAATTATFRLAGDVHYASDVITGALVGSLVGYAVPLLHYGSGSESPQRSGRVRLQLIPAAGGLGVLGSF